MTKPNYTWKPEVRSAGEHAFNRNGLVFATQPEAKAAAQMQYCKQADGVEYRAVRSEEPTNSRWIGGMTETLEDRVIL